MSFGLDSECETHGKIKLTSGCSTDSAMFDAPSIESPAVYTFTVPAQA
jgi:hypothetical protein